MPNLLLTIIKKHKEMVCGIRIMIKTKRKTYRKKPIKNLSWPQAKVRFPLMRPLGDADGDKLKNKFDCKPFDIKRQGERHSEEEDEELKKELSPLVSNPDEYVDVLKVLKNKSYI